MSNWLSRRWENGRGTQYIRDGCNVYACSSIQYPFSDIDIRSDNYHALGVESKDSLFKPILLPILFEHKPLFTCMSEILDAREVSRINS